MLKLESNQTKVDVGKGMDREWEERNYVAWI